MRIDVVRRFYNAHAKSGSVPTKRLESRSCPGHGGRGKNLDQKSLYAVIFRPGGLADTFLEPEFRFNDCWKEG